MTESHISTQEMVELCEWVTQTTCIILDTGYFIFTTENTPGRLYEIINHIKTTGEVGVLLCHGEDEKGGVIYMESFYLMGLLPKIIKFDEACRTSSKDELRRIHKKFKRQIKKTI